MPKGIRNLSLLCAVALAISAVVMAGQKDYYLHIQVDDPAEGESVNVNVPLSLAEKYSPQSTRETFIKAA
jgi:hypothetical protein